MTRTCDLLVRSQTLYPTELRARYFEQDTTRETTPLVIDDLAAFLRGTRPKNAFPVYYT
jgi:hypothetical protein